jgi:hypothetical protein
MEVHPEMHHFDNPSDNFTHKLSIPSISNVVCFKDDLFWDLDTSIWAMLKEPEDAEVMNDPKASDRKHKK